LLALVGFLPQPVVGCGQFGGAGFELLLELCAALSQGVLVTASRLLLQRLIGLVAGHGGDPPLPPARLRV
jgi:hypothetical protein